MVFTLYKLDASPPARAVMMTLKALNIEDVEYIDVNLLKGEHVADDFVKMNPQHTVPTLKDDDFVIWDSHAIAAYLVTKYAEDDSLYPTDPKKRALVDQRLHFDSGILFPALRGTVAPVFFGGEKSFRQENLDKIIAAYNFTETFLDKEWIAGDTMTIADICAVATISSLNQVIPIDADKYPNITGWLDRFSKIDFYSKINAPGVEQFGGLLKSLVA